jgi:hypothetical protein
VLSLSFQEGILREKSVYETTSDYDGPDGNLLVEHPIRHISGPLMEKSAWKAGFFTTDSADWVELPDGAKVWRVTLRWEGSDRF